MLHYNRGRSPSPGPRGFWEAGTSYHDHRPRYETEYPCAHEGPRGHEYHNMQRYDIMQEYGQDQQLHHMRKDPSPPIDRRQRNYPNHHSDNSDFYDNLAAYIKHKIHETRDMVSNQHIPYDDRPHYHNDVRSRAYDRYDDRPKSLLGPDLGDYRGYDIGRDIAERQDFERRRSDHDRDRRRDHRDYTYFDESSGRGLLGDAPFDYERDMRYGDHRFTAPVEERPSGLLGSNPHDYGRGQFHARDAGSMPRRYHESIPRRRSGERPSHLQYSPEKRQRRPTTFRDHSNSRSLRGKVSPPQKRKIPMSESNAKKQRKNERKTKVSPQKKDEGERPSLLTRKDLLERDIASPESSKTITTQEPIRLRDLREEINESRGSRPSSPEIQQDLRYDINKSRADRYISPALDVTSGKSVVLRDQRVLCDSSQSQSSSTDENTFMSQTKESYETSEIKMEETETITIDKKHTNQEESEALSSNDADCKTSIRQVEFCGGQSSTESICTEATTAEKKQTNEENTKVSTSRKTCETSIRKVQVCGGHSRSPSPRVFEIEPPHILPGDDLRLLLLSRRQKSNGEDESESIKLAPPKKQRTEDTKDVKLETAERVVDPPIAENNTNKAVSNKDGEKKETSSSRTVKPPRRKQKNNKTKPTIATAPKNPVKRKVGLAKEKSDVNANETLPEQPKPSIEKTNTLELPSQKNETDVANSLNYSMISEDSNCNNSDDKNQDKSLTCSLISEDSNTLKLASQKNENDIVNSFNYSMISEDSNCDNYDQKVQNTKVINPTTENVVDDSSIERNGPASSGESNKVSCLEKETQSTDLYPDEEPTEQRTTCTAHYWKSTKFHPGADSSCDSNKASCLEKETQSTYLYSDDEPTEQRTTLPADDWKSTKFHPGADSPRKNTACIANESSTSESSDNTSSSLSSSSSTLDTSTTSSTSSDSKHDKSSESTTSSFDTSTSSSSTSSDTSSRSKSNETDSTNTSAEPSKTHNKTEIIIESGFKRRPAKNSKLTVFRKHNAFRKPHVLSSNATRPSIDLNGDFIPLLFTENETLDETKMGVKDETTTFLQSTPLKKNTCETEEPTEFRKHVPRFKDLTVKYPEVSERTYDSMWNSRCSHKRKEQVPASTKPVKMLRYDEAKTPQDIQEPISEVSQKVVSRGSETENAKPILKQISKFEDAVCHSSNTYGSQEMCEQISGLSQGTSEDDSEDENTQELPKRFRKYQSPNLRPHNLKNEYTQDNQGHISDQHHTLNEKDISINSSSSSEYDPAFPTKSNSMRGDSSSEYDPAFPTNSMRGDNSSVEHNTSSEYDPVVDTADSISDDDNITYNNVKAASHDSDFRRRCDPLFSGSQTLPKPLSNFEKNRDLFVSKKVANDKPSYKSCHSECDPITDDFDSHSENDNRTFQDVQSKIRESQHPRNQPQEFITSHKMSELYNPEVVGLEFSEPNNTKHTAEIVDQNASQNVRIQESFESEPNGNCHNARSDKQAEETPSYLPNEDKDDRSLKDLTTKESSITENDDVQTKLNQNLPGNCEYSNDTSQNNQEKVVVVETSNEYIFLQVDTSGDVKNSDDYSIMKTLTGENVSDISIYEADEALESPDKPEGCRGIGDHGNIDTTQEAVPYATALQLSNQLPEPHALNSANMSEASVPQNSSNSEINQGPSPDNLHDLSDGSSNGSSSSNETSSSTDKFEKRPGNLLDLCDDSSNGSSSCSEPSFADSLEATRSSSLHDIFGDSSNDSTRSKQNHLADNEPGQDIFSDTNLTELFDDVSNDCSNSSGTSTVGSHHTEDDNEEALWHLSITRKDNDCPPIGYSEETSCSDNKTVTSDMNPDKDLQLFEIIDLSYDSDKPKIDVSVKASSSKSSCYDYVEITSSSDHEISQSQTSSKTSFQNSSSLRQYESSESDRENRFIFSSENNRSIPYDPEEVSPLQITSSGNDSETSKTIKFPDSGDMSLETPSFSESELERTLTEVNPTSTSDVVPNGLQFEYPISENTDVSVSPSTETEPENMTSLGKQFTPYNPENAFPLETRSSLTSPYNPEDSTSVEFISSGNDSEFTKCSVPDSEDMSLETPCTETSESDLTSQINYAPSKLLESETDDSVKGCASVNTIAEPQSVTFATNTFNSKSDYLDHAFKRLEQFRTQLKDSCTIHGNSHIPLTTPSLTNPKPCNKMSIDAGMPPKVDSSSSIATITSGSEADAEISTGFSSPDSLPRKSPCTKLDNINTLEKCNEDQPEVPVVDSLPVELLQPSESIFERRLKKQKVVQPGSSNANSQTDHFKLKTCRLALVSKSVKPGQSNDKASIKHDSHLDEVYSPGNFSPLEQTPTTDFSESSPEKPVKRRKVLLTKRKSTKTVASDRQFDEVYSPRSFVPDETHRNSRGKVHRTAEESSRKRRNLSQSKRSDHRHSKDAGNVNKGLGSQHDHKTNAKHTDTLSTKLPTPKKSLKDTCTEGTESNSDRNTQPCMDDDKTNELLLNEGRDLLELALEESFRKKATSSHAQAEQTSAGGLESSNQSNQYEAESDKLALKLDTQKKISNLGHSPSLVQDPSVEQGVTDKVHTSSEGNNEDDHLNTESSSNESSYKRPKQENIEENKLNVFNKTGSTDNKLDNGCQNAVSNTGTTESPKDSNVASKENNPETDTLTKLSGSTQTAHITNIVPETASSHSPSNSSKNNDPTAYASTSENSEVYSDKQDSSTNGSGNENGDVLEISLGDYIDAQLKTNTQNNESSPSAPLTSPSKKRQSTSVPQLPDIELPFLKPSPLKENQNIEAKELSGLSPKPAQSPKSRNTKSDPQSSMEPPSSKAAQSGKSPITKYRQPVDLENFSPKSSSCEGSPKKHWQNVKFPSPKLITSKESQNYTAKQSANLESAICKTDSTMKSSSSSRNLMQTNSKSLPGASPSKEGRNTLSRIPSNFERPPIVEPGSVIATGNEANQPVDERTSYAQEVCHEKVISILRKRVDVEKAYKKECESALNAVKTHARETKASRKELQKMLETSLSFISQKYISELQSFVRFTTE